MAKIVRRKQDKKRRYSVKSKGRLVVFLVLLLIVVAVLVINSGFFDVKEIEIYGLQTVSKYDVLNAASEVEGMNIFRIREKQVKEQIKRSNPSLEVLDIVRVFPNKVEIYLKERSVEIEVPGGAGYVHIDSEGYAVSTQASSQAVLMHVAGISAAEPVELGERIKFDDEQQESDFYSLLEQMRLYGLISKTETLDMTVSDDVRIILREGFILRLGLPIRIREKLANYEPMLEEMRQKGLGVLDLSSVDKPYFAPFATESPEEEESE